MAMKNCGGSIPYCSRIIWRIAFPFFFIFGGFSNQLAIFLGVVGLSVSVNGGLKRKPVLTDRRRDTAQQPYAIEVR